MQTLDGPRWRVDIDAPQVLQLAAFVGQREAFGAPGSESQALDSPAEAEWRDWWESLIRETASSSAHLAVFVGAPEFELLEGRPLLRGLCRIHWEDFLADWRLEKRPLVERIAAQSSALQIQDVVTERERQLGRRSRDFHWRLYFVRWPEGFLREVSESQTVLGVGFLDATRFTDLRAVAQSRLSALV